MILHRRENVLKIPSAFSRDLILSAPSLLHGGNRIDGGDVNIDHLLAAVGPASQDGGGGGGDEEADGEIDKLNQVTCEYFNGTNTHTETVLDVAHSPQDTSKLIEYCGESIDSRKAHCYALWKYDNANSGYDILKKGCWLNDANCGSEPKCYPIIASPRRKKIKAPIPHHLFCCCLGDRCNFHDSVLLNAYHEGRTSSVPFKTAPYSPPKATGLASASSPNRSQQFNSTRGDPVAIKVTPLTMSAVPGNSTINKLVPAISTAKEGGDSIVNFFETAWDESPSSRTLLLTACSLGSACLVALFIFLIWFILRLRKRCCFYYPSSTTSPSRKIRKQKQQQQQRKRTTAMYGEDKHSNGFIVAGMGAKKDSIFYTPYTLSSDPPGLKSEKYDILYRPSQNAAKGRTNDSNNDTCSPLITNLPTNPTTFVDDTSCYMYHQRYKNPILRFNSSSSPTTRYREDFTLLTLLRHKLSYALLIKCLQIVFHNHQNHYHNHDHYDPSLYALYRDRNLARQEVLQPRGKLQKYKTFFKGIFTKNAPLGGKFQESSMMFSPKMPLPRFVLDLDQESLMYGLNCLKSSSSSNEGIKLLSKSSISTVTQCKLSQIFNHFYNNDDIINNNNNSPLTPTCKYDSDTDLEVAVKIYTTSGYDSWMNEMKIYALLIYGLPFNETISCGSSLDLLDPHSYISGTYKNYNNQHPNLLPLLYGTASKHYLNPNEYLRNDGDCCSVSHYCHEEIKKMRNLTCDDIMGDGLINRKLISSIYQNQSIPILITPLQTQGSLYTYLKSNLIDWGNLVAVALDISRGLSYLHNTNNLYDYYSDPYCEHDPHQTADSWYNHGLNRQPPEDQISPTSTLLLYNDSHYPEATEGGKEGTPSYLPKCSQNTIGPSRNCSGKKKPSILHKDLKSTNILLEPVDPFLSFSPSSTTTNTKPTTTPLLRAKIADFGSSLIMDNEVVRLGSLPTFHQNNRSKFDSRYNNEHPKSREILHEKGTLRYTAPEILEGAISYTVDSFLKIDVYAYALILWELMTRCTNINDLSLVKNASFKLPYEHELGQNPSMEDLQNHVCAKGLRPKILEIWNTHSKALSIVTTINDCWEKDPEARISSLTLYERMKDL